MKPKVVLTHRAFRETVDMLRPYCQVITNDSSASLPREEMLRRCSDADAMMAFMPDRIDDEFLAACPRLKIIAAALKGYDNFDVDACTARAVWLTIVQDFLTAPTADLTIGLLLAVSRQIAAADRYVRSGAFHGWRPTFYGTGLSGETVGLIGMGGVGQAIARRLQGFDADLIYFDSQRLDHEVESQLGLTYASLDEVVGSATYLVPMLPYTAETKHLIDAVMIAKMPGGAFLINVCRGSVVNEAAVAQALMNEHLAGYAADVFEFEEWTRPDRPLRIHPELLAMRKRTVFTPHLGSAVAKARRKIEQLAAQSIIEVLQGIRPSHAINEIVSVGRR